MRILPGLVIALALGWAGLWLVSARLVERGAESWFAERAAAGALAEHAGLAVTGFPGRLALEIAAPRLGDPQAGMLWQGAGLVLRYEALRPGTLVAEPAGPHRLRLGGLPLTLETGQAHASARLAGTALRLAEAGVSGRDWRLEAPGGGQVALTALELGATTEAAAADRPRLRLALEGLTVERLTLPPGLPPLPSGGLAGQAQLAVSLDAPLDRHLGDRTPQLRALAVETADFAWGESRLTAAGGFTVAPDGRPEGRVTFRVTGWQGLLSLAVAAGAVAPELAPTWERVLATLEAASPAPGVLELPLVFQRGRMSLGPLPLGPAPRLAAPRG